MGIASVVKKILNRAVCGEESRVMFIEGVPPLPCRFFLRCEAIKKEKPNKVQCDADEIDIYLQQEASPFSVLCCQSVASQDGTRNRNRNMY